MKEETDYVIPMLRRYGNTIITKKDLKKVGGKEIFLKILKSKGLVCELKEPTENIEYKRNGKGAYSHFIVQVKEKS